MNILFTCHYNFNTDAGAAGVTWRLGQEYERLGHRASYYSLDSLPAALPPMVKVIAFPEFVAHQISLLERQHAVDIIDASTGDGWLWSVMRSRSWSAPLMIARCHGLEHIEHLEYQEEVRRGNLHFSWKYPLYRGSIRLWEAAISMRQADLALFLNRRDRDYAIEYLGVHPDRAKIIANGIPKSFLNLPFETLPEDIPIRIAQVGTYIVRKGVQYATPALTSILAKHPQVKLSLLGTDCPVEKVYADFDPSLRDRITVVPHYSHNRLPDLLKGHQIKLFPTISEGFGVALIEAMACGLAPITTHAPGPMEIVHPGQDAIVIPCRDTNAIVQALDQLICDRPYLEQLRRNAYETAQRYSWTRIAQDNLAYYEQARYLRNDSHDCITPTARN